MSTVKIQIGNVMEQDVCVNKLTPSMPRNGTCKRVPIKFCLIISRVFLFLLRSAWRFLWFRKIKVHIRNGRRAKPTTTWFFFLVSWEIYVPDFRFYELRICFHVRIFRLRKGQLLISVYLYVIFFGGKRNPQCLHFIFFPPCWLIRVQRIFAQIQAANMCHQSSSPHCTQLTTPIKFSKLSSFINPKLRRYPK